MWSVSICYTVMAASLAANSSILFFFVSVPVYLEKYGDYTGSRLLSVDGLASPIVCLWSAVLPPALVDELGWWLERNSVSGWRIGHVWVSDAFLCAKICAFPSDPLRPVGPSLFVVSRRFCCGPSCVVLGVGGLLLVLCQMHCLPTTLTDYVSSSVAGVGITF